jgi:hypothetical protein
VVSARLKVTKDTAKALVKNRKRAKARELAKATPPAVPEAGELEELLGPAPVGAGPGSQPPIVKRPDNPGGLLPPISDPAPAANLQPLANLGTDRANYGTLPQLADEYRALDKKDS